MQLQFDPNIAYECVQCGKGCYNRWDILVEPAVMDRLSGHPLELRVIQERGAAFKEGLINKTEEHPGCGFLQSDMLCSVHKELGYQAKPLTCQQYPYLMTQTPDGVIHVSAAYSCTAVREEIGPPLEESRAAIEDLLSRGGRVHRLVGPIEVLPPFHATWSDCQAFEEELQRRWSNRTVPQVLEDAIVGLAKALGSLGQPDQETVMLPPGLLASTWTRSTQAGPQLQLLQMILTMGLLKPCLYSQDREVWRKIDEAVLGSGDLDLPDFNWNAPLSELELWVNTGVGNRFDPLIERYQHSLLFRKAHLTMGGLLPGLVMLWVIPGILRLLTGLYAWKEQREPELTDFLWALERAETCLVGHTFDTVPVYRQGAWQAIAVCQE
ncbi:YkgJ family cysteine cluster protein [bacterium]|nr:YkgJ family cysteine cluster protein [bacterium]